MNKIKIAVLMGGNSTEHEISLISGREVVNNLDQRKYDIFPIVISSDGNLWDYIPKKDFQNSTPKKRTTKFKQFSEIEKAVDIVFIALHGAGGEDGKIQAYLELKGVLYTGSGVLSSALCMDKEKTKIMLKDAAIKVPLGASVRKGESRSQNKRLNFPAFVKPNSHGSSVGAAIAKNQKELEVCLKEVHKIDEIALVEEYIQGTEITASVLGTKNPRTLPLVEIVSKNAFFDYQSKYDPKLSDEICPARISIKVAKQAQQIALVAYKKLVCKSFARVDMIIKNNQIYVLEINTIPGLTPVSLFPKAAKAAGISYSNLLDMVIEDSLPHSLIQN